MTNLDIAATLAAKYSQRQALAEAIAAQLDATWAEATKQANERHAENGNTLRKAVNKYQAALDKVGAHTKKVNSPFGENALVDDMRAIKQICEHVRGREYEVDDE